MTTAIEALTKPQLVEILNDFQFGPPRLTQQHKRVLVEAAYRLWNSDRHDALMDRVHELQDANIAARQARYLRDLNNGRYSTRRRT